MENGIWIEKLKAYARVHRTEMRVMKFMKAIVLLIMLSLAVVPAAGQMTAADDGIPKRCSQWTKNRILYGRVLWQGTICIGLCGSV